MGKAAAGGAGADQFLQIPAGATNVTRRPGRLGQLRPGRRRRRATAGFLSLGKFANEGGLERSSSNRWRSTVASGAEQVGTPSRQLRPDHLGTVEMSNVDLASQFTNMITAQRGFQANSRIISASDEVLQDLVNMKR